MTYFGDITFPLLRDVESQAPDAICDVRPTNVTRTLIVNRDKPPFDDPRIRRAMLLARARQAFIDILSEGQGRTSVVSGKSVYVGDDLGGRRSIKKKKENRK